MNRSPDFPKPICVLCRKVMTPDNAKIHPEYFYCDGCLPDDLRPKSRAATQVKYEVEVAANDSLGFNLVCRCGWKKTFINGTTMELLRETEAQHMLEHERSES